MNYFPWKDVLGNNKTPISQFCLKLDKSFSSILYRHLTALNPIGAVCRFTSQLMNSTKLVIPLHSLYWSIHTKDESKRGTAFAFIFGVN